MAVHYNEVSACKIWPIRNDIQPWFWIQHTEVMVNLLSFFKFNVFIFHCCQCLFLCCCRQNCQLLPPVESVFVPLESENSRIITYVLTGSSFSWAWTILLCCFPVGIRECALNHALNSRVALKATNEHIE